MADSFDVLLETALAEHGAQLLDESRLLQAIVMQDLTGLAVEPSAFSLVLDGHTADGAK